MDMVHMPAGGIRRKSGFCTRESLNLFSKAKEVATGTKPGFGNYDCHGSTKVAGLCSNVVNGIMVLKTKPTYCSIGLGRKMGQAFLRFMTSLFHSAHCENEHATVHPPKPSFPSYVTFHLKDVLRWDWVRTKQLQQRLTSWTKKTYTLRISYGRPVCSCEMDPAHVCTFHERMIFPVFQHHWAAGVHSLKQLLEIPLWVLLARPLTPAPWTPPVLHPPFQHSCSAPGAPAIGPVPEPMMWGTTVS